MVTLHNNDIKTCKLVYKLANLSAQYFGEFQNNSYHFRLYHHPPLKFNKSRDWLCKYPYKVTSAT